MSWRHSPAQSEIDEQPWIQIASACPHHATTGRRKAHRGIERLAMAHRRQAGAIPQVSDDGASQGWGPHLVDDLLVGEPVKAVSPYPCIPDGARQGEALCQLGHATMKGGVEAGHLRQVRKPCGHGLNPLDFRREVERRIGNQLPQVREESRIHLFWSAMVGTTVHDAMPTASGVGAAAAPGYQRQPGPRLDGHGMLSALPWEDLPSVRGPTGGRWVDRYARWLP